LVKNTRDLEELPPIKVVGVGGGGCNAVSRMASEKIPGVQLVAVNTDRQALVHVNADVQIRIGDKLTKGLGAGGDPARGLRSAEESRDELKEAVRGAEMVFVTAGMGGGTGTGASSIVAEVARESGALTIGVVTKPFSFEGKRRAMRAEEGIAALQQKVDTLIVIPNDRLLQITDAKVSFEDSFKLADDVLRQGIQGISEVITLAGVINLDFADVRRIMSESGPALLAIGRGKGENRAAEAARAAITSPLLETSITGARGVLFNIVGGKNLALHEINAAAKVINEMVHDDAEIIFGAAIDPELGDEVKVTLIATGFEPKQQTLTMPMNEPHTVPAETAPSQTPAEQPAAAAAASTQADRDRALRPDSIPNLDTELPAFLRRSVPAR